MRVTARGIVLNRLQSRIRQQNQCICTKNLQKKILKNFPKNRKNAARRSEEKHNWATPAQRNHKAQNDRTAEQDKKLRESIKKESPPVDPMQSNPKPKPEDQLTDEAVHNKLKEAIKSNFTSFNVPSQENSPNFF